MTLQDARSSVGRAYCGGRFQRMSASRSHGNHGEIGQHGPSAQCFQRLVVLVPHVLEFDRVILLRPEPLLFPGARGEGFERPGSLAIPLDVP